MDNYSHTNIERDPPSRLRDLENGVCTCARADALHRRHEQSSSNLIGPYSRTKFERNSPSRLRHLGKRGVHVRTCRCTPPQTCVKLLSNGYLFTHKILMQFAQPFATSGKRGVHVRTCRCTPPQTCVKLLSNGYLFTHKI